jgi:hypothetical protein
MLHCKRRVLLTRRDARCSSGCGTHGFLGKLAMVWLIMVEGLPIGAWHIQIGQEGICNLCTKSSLKTTKHGLMWCAIIQEVWCNFRDFKIRSLLLPRYFSWEKVLLGELQQCHNELVDEKMEWDIRKLCIISMRTPWDI